MKQFLFFLTIILALLPGGVMARSLGQAFLDSVAKQLPLAKEDSDKVNLLIILSSNYSSIDPVAGLKYGQQALELAQELQWKKGIASAYNFIGVNYDARADIADALDNYLKALELNESTHDKVAQTSTLTNIAVLYDEQGSFDKALTYYIRSLKLNEDISNKRGLLSCLGNLGNHYGMVSDVPKALECFKRALSVSEELHDADAAARNKASIGNIYSMARNYPAALKFYFSALRSEEAMGITDGIVVSLGNIGSAYLAIAKDTARLVPDSLVLPGRHANLLKAIEYLDRSISLAKQISYKTALLQASHGASEAYALAGDYEHALDRYKQYSQTKDSVFNMENSIKIANLETKRDLELKDKQIEIDKLAIAKKRNERGFFIAGIVVMLAIIVIVSRNYKTQKATNTLLSVEKQKSEDLLLNILPTEVADELKQKGAANARQYDDVTVLFTDFVNFTMAGERMTPQQLVGELHTCFKAFDGILDKYNIEKIKTVGDAYLAVSGLPASNPDHARDVVSAAIEIRDYMLKRKAQLGDNTFGVRIGIHSGSVVAGIVGVKKFAYDIWGDTVNTAARMEQNSEEGKVNISEATYQLVKDNFSCSPRGKIEVKSKGVIDMYFVG